MVVFFYEQTTAEPKNLPTLDGGQNLFMVIYRRKKMYDLRRECGGEFMRRILAIVLAFVLLITGLPVAFAKTEVQSSWSIKDVEEMKQYGVFRDDAFKNYQSGITRLDFIYIAVRVYEILSEKEIVIDSALSFTDTADVYALKGATIGITSGVGDGMFGSNEILTREQLAVMMIKIVRLLKFDMNDASQVKFADDVQLSSWARESIYLALSNHIISGVGSNKFDPQGTASTEMALVIANKLLKTNGYERQTANEQGTNDIQPLSLSANKGRYQLNTTSSTMKLWTDYPSERIFRDDPVPNEVDDGIDVYLARNEFEPFQVVVNASKASNIIVNTSPLPKGLEIEMHQVEYVFLDKNTDSLGRTGWYPDPLYPVEMNTSIAVKANENTPLWFTIKSDKAIMMGDYALTIQINDIEVPVRVHVFDFSIPDELHVKSQINLSTNSILKKYGVSGTSENYWKYVDLVKQFMIDHRLTPKSVLWSGGLTSGGGAPYIQYDSQTGKFSDPHGIWGFEYPAMRYLDGAVNSANKNLGNTTFNEGTGFPSFMAMTFRTNDASADQRPDKFEGITRQATDWYTNNNLKSAYNQKWFEYIKAIEVYLAEKGYLDKAYYYFANEPQDQVDYDAVSWYAKALKSNAPNLKLMISEEPKPEIYNNPNYPGVKIDQWLAVLNKYDPKISWDREANHNEETWIYFLHGTKPPYFNPITLDHPGIESKLTAWFLWKYRIKGIAHYSFNNWSENVWKNQMISSHNGDAFMLYPPGRDNQPIEYGATNHRLVTSIRFELLRDSLEDYEYLYVLNELSQPVVYKSNVADDDVDKIIYGLTSYNRDSQYMYLLRQNMGLKISGIINEIPEIEASEVHERSLATNVAYRINFQDPNGKPLASPLVIEGKTYLKVGWNAYDEKLGYGWFGDLKHVMYQYIDGAPNELKGSILYDDWGREKVFEFDLPNGEYVVTVCCGWQGKTYARNQIVIEGVPFITDEATKPYLERTHQIKIKDNKLTLEMGIFDEYTMLNYLDIIPVNGQ